MNELRDKGLGLAAISYDRPEILADFSQRHGITFPLLSDAGSATIKVFGLLNTFAEDAVGPGREDPGVADNVHTFVASAFGRASQILLWEPFAAAAPRRQCRVRSPGRGGHGLPRTGPDISS